MIKGSKVRITILLTAYDRFLNGQQEMSLEDLAVLSWKASPILFGLAGYQSLYPDMRKFYLTFCGKKGFIRQGLFYWTNPSHRKVMLTTNGLQVVKDLQVVESKPKEVITELLPTVECLPYVVEPARKQRVNEVVEKFRSMRELAV